jgi:general L-amino acid transport system substrate-binding protein
VLGSLSRALYLTVAAIAATAGPVQAADSPRLAAIKARGYVACGIPAESVPGFSALDSAGRARGFDVDFCRAVAAAIFGTGERFRALPVATARQFLQSPDLDLVFHGLTWNFTRELTSGLSFGPIIFHDGQAFLARRAPQPRSIRTMARATICVEAGSIFASNLAAYLQDNGLEHPVTPVQGRLSTLDAFLAGRCDLVTADASLLFATTAGRGDGLEILPDRISKEPLAPVVRNEDGQLLTILRWTAYAVIEAEEIGLTAASINDPAPGRRSIAELFDLTASQALGLPANWAYETIRAVGNYGEIYERNLVGAGMATMPRGSNEIWTKGGLLYAPPLR